MSEPSKTDGNSSQINSAIAFIALLLSVFAVQNIVFQSTRPPMETTDREFSELVRSRLWQDPFQAVEEHRKLHRAQKNARSLELPDEIFYKEEGNDQQKKMILTASKKPGNILIEKDGEDKHHYEHDNAEPRLVCYDEKITKRDSGYSDSELIANSIEELQCHIGLKIEKDKKQLQILAVMVPNGPYAEDKEWRLRSRYAVVAALTERGYTPEDAEHIDYVDFDRTCKTALQELRGKSDQELKRKTHQELKRKTHFCHMGSVMPYEWFSFSSKEKQENVLLLWLDNSGFVNTDNQTPLKMLSFLKEEILKFDQKLSFNIIGPFGSDALYKMYDEVSSVLPGVFKPSSQFGQKYSFNIIDPLGSGELKPTYLEVNSVYNYMPDVFKPPSDYYYKALQGSSFYVAAATVNFDTVNKRHELNDEEQEKVDWLNQIIVRTIGTQDKLADLLLCELALRGVTPYDVGDGKTLSKICLPKKNKEDEFRYSEGDEPHHIVLIGEMDTFYSQQLTETFKKAIKKFNDSEEETPWVHTYSYLRGLDGITSEHAPSGHQEVESKKHDRQANNTNAAEAREQMERPIGPSQLDYLLNLARQIKRLDKQYAHEGGIKAIGITGHDLYDKLLILQALRLQFPGVLFFTTDLDARFLHPSEIKWTRNLLVASPFGLQLNEDLQKKTPPFRESYQTSLFLAAQLALCKDDKEKQKGSACDSDIFGADNKQWIDKPRLFEIGNEGAVDISHEPNAFLDPYNEKDKKPITIERIKEFSILLSLLVMMAVLVITFFAPKDFQKPKPLIFFAVCLVLFFAIVYFPVFKLEPLSFTSGISMWPSIFMKAMAILLSVYFFYRIYKKLLDSHEDTEKNYLQPEVKQKDIANKGNKNFNCSGAESIWIDRWRKDLSNEEVKDKQLFQFFTLWDEYRCWGNRKLTMKRVGIALIVTALLCTAIISTPFYDVTFHHIRGQSNYEINLWWLGLAVLFYVLLILYVADRVHLSSHFIKLLANPKVEINWPVAVVQTYRNKYDLPGDVVRYRILLDFINDHCFAPNKFIYYPFFCFFLIVMSRNYYFDNWPTTPFVLAVYAFFALLTLISAIRLRAAALYARKQILDKLENNSVDAPVNALWCRRQNDTLKLQSFINQIRDFKEGIYRPLAYHPMVLNLLVPFSSVGGIYLIEYLV